MARVGVRGQRPRAGRSLRSLCDRGLSTVTVAPVAKAIRKRSTESTVPAGTTQTLAFNPGAGPGPHEVLITGSVDVLGQLSTNITEVVSFGRLGIQALDETFQNADTLASVAPLPPTVTSLHQMMLNSDATPTGMESWDVSNVTDFSQAFYDASAFNRDISGWDTSAATRMDRMFQLADAFNQDISGWDVGSVTTFEQIFNGADLFDQPLGPWDVTADLSAWCVDEIGSRPDFFAPSGQLAAEPSWGKTVTSCPSP